MYRDIEEKSGGEVLAKRSSEVTDCEVSWDWT